MKFKVYAVRTCDLCMTIRGGLMALEYPHEVLNGNDPQHAAYLDANNVDKFPLVQLVDDEGKVVWSKSGDQGVSLKDIIDQYAAKHRTRTGG